MRVVLAATLVCFVSTLAYCAGPIEDKTPRAEAIKANFDKLVSEDKAVKREALLYFGKVDKTFAAEVPLFTASLKDKRNQVRAISAYALGKIGQAAAGSIPEVEKLLTDSSATVQKYAKRALERLKPFRPVPKKPAPEGVAEAQNPYRKWTSPDGKNSIVARLVAVSVEDGLVSTLQSADGKTLRLPFDQFSQADLEYLKSTNEVRRLLDIKSWAAIETIEELGGAVQNIDFGNREIMSVNFPAGNRVTDDDLVFLKELTKLEDLLLFETKITDAGLVHLKGLTNLKRLNLMFSPVTDAGLIHLKGLTKLERLALNSTKVTDAGLPHLKGLTGLRELDLAGTKVTDSGLEHLKGLTKLRELYLRQTKVTDAGVKKLQQALPKCKVFEGNLTDPNMEIRVLEKRAGTFAAQYSRVRNLIVAKAPGAEESSGALLNQMQNWIVEWDRVMKPFQDAKGNLKPEFKGYISTRKRVSKLINELSKARELEAKAKSNPRASPPPKTLISPILPSR